MAMITSSRTLASFSPKSRLSLRSREYLRTKIVLDPKCKQVAAGKESLPRTNARTRQGQSSPGPSCRCKACHVVEFKCQLDLFGLMLLNINLKERVALSQAATRFT